MKSAKTWIFISIIVLVLTSVNSAPGQTVGQASLQDLLKAFPYREIGPTRESGRFVDFAVPNGQPYTFYAATGSGGLWKTVNNGQSFEPIFDHENVFSIGDIAVAPSDPNIVWVGTGEANNSRSTYWGDGVYKSVDAGKTWKNTGLKESHHIGRILVHPKNPDVVYVAALGHLYTDNPDRGLYKTFDGGKTWQKILDVKVGNKNIGCVDIVMSPENPDILWAATYDRLRRPWTYMIGGTGSGIHKSEDGGKTWRKLGKGLPGGILGRIGLAVYLRNAKILYACIENTNKPGMSPEARYAEVLAGKSSQGMIDGEVYRSDDGGESWRKVSPEKQSIGGNPGYWYGQIIIDPNDDKIVYVLSVAVFVSKDAGKNWNRRAFNFGGDNHVLWINPDDSRHMLLGYDHGLGVTFDGGKNWFHPDFLPLAQLYAVGVDMSYPYRVAGGLQDNGSAMGPSTKRGRMATGEAMRLPNAIRLEDWHNVGSGDGMYNVFDWKTNRYLYNESQFGPLQRVDLVTGEQKSIAYKNTRKDLRWNWCAPVLVSPHNADVVYHGANILVKSPFRGESWQEISPDLTTNDPAKLPNGKGGDGNIEYCTITTIDESPLVEGLLWVGTDDGNVWVTKDAGKNWTKLNDRISGNPGYWVSRVAASFRDPGTAYVSYTGYREDDFRPFLYKTTDYGQTWTSIAANLPNAPVNVIREDPKRPDLLFAGTEFGVYVTLDGGKSWMKMKNNMPTQPVHDLLVHPRESDLVVATHGRGIFIADISALEELTEDILAKDVHLFSVEPKVKWASGLRNHSSSSNFSGTSEPVGLVINYFLKSKPKSEVKVRIFKGNVLVNEIKGTSNAGISSVVWNMTRRRERTEEEKKAMQERMQRFAGMGFGMPVDPNFAYDPVTEGEYRVVLDVDGKETTGIAAVLRDEWAEK